MTLTMEQKEEEQELHYTNQMDGVLRLVTLNGNMVVGGGKRME